MAAILQILFPCLSCGDKLDDETTVVSRYDGERNCLGQKHGYGDYLFPNGDLYQGCWKYNKMHGYGEYKYSSGQLRKGFYRNGIFIGEQYDQTTVSSNEYVQPQPFPQTVQEQAHRDERRIERERIKNERDKERAERKKIRDEFYQKYPNAKRRVKKYGATQGEGK